MKKSLFVFILLSEIFSLKLFAQHKNEKTLVFGFRQFCCDKTTENGADELYFLIVGKSQDGETFFNFARWPGIDSHIDMNDGGQPNDMDQKGGGDSHCITNRDIVRFKVSDGNSFNFTIIVCEEDRGNSGQYQKAAEEILSKSDDPYAQSGAAILAVLNKFGIKINDTDDYMGMFGVSVSSNNGNITTSYKAKEGIDHIIPDPDDPGNIHKKEIRMNHDGSNYVGWFHVEP